jgi:hypothetical protein
MKNKLSLSEMIDRAIRLEPDHDQGIMQLADILMPTIGHNERREIYRQKLDSNFCDPIDDVYKDDYEDEYLTRDEVCDV